jgi:hypothetical protein
MADNIVPSNPNINVPTPQPGNVATLVSPNTLSNLKNSLPPSTFGQQIINSGTQQVIKATSNSPIAKLYKEKADLIQEGIQLDIDHQKTLAKLQQDNTPSKKVVNGQTVDVPPKLSNEEYIKAVAIEDKNYDIAKKNLQARKIKNQKDIDDFLNDPFKKQKEAKQARQEVRKKAKSRTKEEKKKARVARRKAVLQNAKKTIVPILILLLTDKLADIISQNDKIKELVNKTNAIIIEANASGDPQKLDNAKIARDSAVKVIQSNEDKIRKINDQISNIATYINIFSVIVSVISAIPIPTAVPPGIGIPVNLIIKLVKILDKANRILLALSAFLPIISTILNKAIDILENYKAQLLNINGVLDAAVASGANTSSGLLGINSGFTFGNIPGEYKGFRFAIREDNSFGGVEVAGYKRHYGVAIDKYNVDVLKSELSFTLDPNDLIDQLKLVIDQQNLQA